MSKRHLFDVNVYLAATFEAHAHHPAARRWVDSIEPPAALAFCRITEMACLRLPTQQVAESFHRLTNRDSAAVYLRWRQDPRVEFVEEPPGIDERWPRLALDVRHSPKLWTDAYLAAFAITGGCRLVTFDGAFRQFEPEGLELLVLDPSRDRGRTGTSTD